MFRATSPPPPLRLASSRSPLLADGRRWRLGRGDVAAVGELRVVEVSTPHLPTPLPTLDGGFCILQSASLGPSCDAFATLPCRWLAVCWQGRSASRLPFKTRAISPKRLTVQYSTAGLGCEELARPCVGPCGGELAAMRGFAGELWESTDQFRRLGCRTVARAASGVGRLWWPSWVVVPRGTRTRGDTVWRDGLVAALRTRNLRSRRLPESPRRGLRLLRRVGGDGPPSCDPGPLGSTAVGDPHPLTLGGSRVRCVAGFLAGGSWAAAGR